MNINELPKKEPERWAAIKMYLELNGYSFGKLAREHGITTSALTLVKKQHYPKSQKIIADKLVLSPEWIWPERYGADGQPIKHSPRYPRLENTTKGKTRQYIKRKRQLT